MSSENSRWLYDRRVGCVKNTVHGQYSTIYRPWPLTMTLNDKLWLKWCIHVCPCQYVVFWFFRHIIKSKVRSIGAFRGTPVVWSYFWLDVGKFGDFCWCGVTLATFSLLQHCCKLFQRQQAQYSGTPVVPCHGSFFQVHTGTDDTFNEKKLTLAF